MAELRVADRHAPVAPGVPRHVDLLGRLECLAVLSLSVMVEAGHEVHPPRMVWVHARTISSGVWVPDHSNTASALVPVAEAHADVADRRWRDEVAHLRRRHRIRRAHQATRARHRSGGIADAVSIRERPGEVADRAVPGHWEGDLLTGGRQSYIATLVERQSRFVQLVRLANKETHTVVAALKTAVRALPAGVMTSLTLDRGSEFAAHKVFTVATNVQVYFCDPQSPWQRGTNENTNGLLRQYFPKGTDLSHYSQEDLDEVALQLNTRPRKTLGYATPADRLAATVASTG